MRPALPPAPGGRASQVLRRLLRPLAGKEPSFYRAVIACFLIASTLWMLRALSNSYTAPINYPVSWHYNPQRYHPARPLPATVPIEVRGNGWRLLSRAMGLHMQPADVRLRLPGTPPFRSPLRPPLRRALGTVRLLTLPNDSATYYLVPGGDSL
ncbi:hypothetical protein [Hymenobacter baengnokdamensis]|uniref:hypothetical protein n=1 Tax=Hymenobacter baengnokdamensis TaxID=2615203 RepID=UPI0012487B71|nr:hypothetical protein [Hymenobacter baengnokdamensis]